MPVEVLISMLAMYTCMGLVVVIDKRCSKVKEPKPLGGLIAVCIALVLIMYTLSNILN